MKRYALMMLLGLSISLLASPRAAAQGDQVRLVYGDTKFGEIIETSRDGVTIERNGDTTEIPITQINAVLFQGEPPQLTQARLNLLADGYETALEQLEGIEGQAGDDLIGQEISFYTALAETRLAIAGARDAMQAGTKLNTFVRDHRDSFHYYEAVEALGDLLASIERYDKAERMYAQMAKGSFPSLKLRAGVLAAGLSERQGKHDEAIRRYDAMLSANARGPKLIEIEQEATLGKAVSLAATGKLDDGLALVRGVLERSESTDETEQASLKATAYNALGRCYEVADQPTDALFAYLHTDLLFNSDRETHAEALAHLVELWREAGKPAAASDALTRLRQQYAATPAARGAG